MEKNFRSNIWTNSILLFYSFLSRCVWPSRERPRTYRASSLSATGARLTGSAPPMVTRNPGAQPSEFIFDQIICSFYWHRVCISDLYISECISDLLIPTGWTDTETTNLETGETAISPPACRGTVATNHQGFSYLSQVSTITMIGSKPLIHVHQETISLFPEGWETMGVPQPLNCFTYIPHKKNDLRTALTCG